MSNQERDLLTRQEAADLLGCHIQNLIYHENKGHIQPAFNPGREKFYDREELLEFKARTSGVDMYTLDEIVEMSGINKNTLRYHLYTTYRMNPDGRNGNAHAFEADNVIRFLFRIKQDEAAVQFRQSVKELKKAKKKKVIEKLEEG